MRSVFCAATVFTLLLICSITASVAPGVSQEFKVTEVFLKADDGRPTGPCPLRVTFRGYITADGPGTIKYTFTRSDGATGPVYIMEFKRAGTQAVVTDWTLGDPKVLSRYAGWQAVKVLSPVEIESSRETGSFEINCGGTTSIQTNPNQQGEFGGNPKGSHAAPGNSDRQLGPPVVQPEAPRRSGADLTAVYESMLPRITVSNLDRFKSDFHKLKSLNDDLASRLDRVPKSANFDKQKLQEELQTILKQKDLFKLEQRIGEFRDRYEPRFIEQLTAAGINVGAERQRAASLLGLEQQQVTPAAYLNAGMVAIGTVLEFVDDRPPVEAAPLFYEDALAAPFISAGTRGAGSADGRNGNLASYAHSPVNAGSRPQQNVAFVGQNFSARPGARRLYVSVSINDLKLYMAVTAIFGDAAAESAINLRVFDGEREVASRKVTLGRLAATVLGINSFNRRFPPMTLGCEFERSSTSGSGNYLIVVEFETLAGSNWFGDARSNASGRVGPFTVRTY
ncbi:MAG TPA: hypothetical protein VFS76_05860 [Pyrinomonadaceae bacterium]|nr:hypothetical protein [Pyrinomonadaceae bacterium]